MTAARMPDGGQDLFGFSRLKTACTYRDDDKTILNYLVKNIKEYYCERVIVRATGML